MKTLKRALVWAVAVCGAQAFANGYQVDIHSSRAMGMASAVTADTNDSSSIYYNPAGLAQGQGIDLLVGDTLILPKYAFTDPAGTKTETNFIAVPPFHAFASLGWNDMFTVGLGVFSQYGSVVDYPAGWEGDGIVRKVDLRTFNINPTVAAHFGAFRLGLGVQIVRGTVEVQQGVVLPDSSGLADLGLGAWGIGANLGLQWDAIADKLMVGATWRSAVPLKFSGNAAFSGIPPELLSQFPNQGITSNIVLPNEAKLGVAYKPAERLRLGLDVVFISWNQFGTLSFKFSQTPVLNQNIPQKWWDTLALHVGAEYHLTEEWDLRAGVMYDPGAAPGNTLTPTIPAATRYNLCAGVGYHWGPLRADLGYQFILVNDAYSRNPLFMGTYSGYANLVGLSLGFHI